MPTRKSRPFSIPVLAFIAAVSHRAPAAADEREELVRAKWKLKYRLDSASRRYDVVGNGVPLRVGDHVVFQVAKKEHLTLFFHRCYKESTEVLWWGEPADDQTKTVPFYWKIIYRVVFVPKRGGTPLPFDVPAAEPAAAKPNRHFIAPSDGTLKLMPDVWNATKYDEAQTKSPCEGGYDHKGLHPDRETEAPWPNTQLRFLLCRPGLKKPGDDECLP